MPCSYTGPRELGDITMSAGAELASNDRFRLVQIVRPDCGPAIVVCRACSGAHEEGACRGQNEFDGTWKLQEQHSNTD